MTAPAYRALRITQDGKRHRCALTELAVEELSPGNVVVAPRYSAINYKDALAALGAAPILRASPLNGGIDAAGIVVRSEDPRFTIGQPVLATGCGLSETRDGGFCERLRVPGDVLIDIPAPFTERAAMILGTAGLTAMLSIMRLEECRAHPDRGPILVTGASGGVGSLAVLLLHRLGYPCIAVTGKPEAHGALHALGASEIWEPAQLPYDKPGLARASIAGAIDMLGGETLPALARLTEPWGAVVSVGVATGADFRGSVAPFVIRGVSILGVTSANCPMPQRREAWRRLFEAVEPDELEALVAATVELEELPELFPQFLDGRARGRTLVHLNRG